MSADPTPFDTLTDRPYIVRAANIDTDQIIPARFLTTTVRDGLGEGLFADWRGEGGGFDAGTARGRRILVAGENFGCGSSREHAPWAIKDFGFDAVLSPKLADIFRANALKNGLLAIDIHADAYAAILDAPEQALTLNLEVQTLAFPGGAVRFDIDPFARRCLLDGVDHLGFLLNRTAEIAAFEAAHS
ncbi:MAG: 3-isopropylmalate dehydratase small subunit [Maricaulaceae bacterium]